MKTVLRVLEKVFGGRLSRQTQQQLIEVAQAATQASRARAASLLQQLAGQPGPHVLLGQTKWGQEVRVPLEALVKAHAIITGGTGSGKTMSALTIIDAILAADTPAMSFGVVDPKTELFSKSIFLIARRLAQLPPARAERLRDRVMVIDLSASHPLTSYNVARPWDGCDADFFATSRCETFQELLPAGEGLSLRGSAIVRYTLKLLAETAVPFGYIERVLADETLRTALLTRAASEDVRYYFRQRFASEGKSTIAAVQARLASALLSTESIRLALSGESVPDFRRFQDEGKIVLVNCGGPNISRTTARTLQSLFLSDIRQAIFARRKQQLYWWVFDEAQNFLRTRQLRENVEETLRQSRSFGSFCLFLTQNLSAAVQDGDVLDIIHSNVKWNLSLRSTPRDANFLLHALPVTGRLPKPRTNPYAPLEYYSLNEERTVRLNRLASLPDRVGWWWLRSLSDEAIKLKTATLEIPSGAAFTEAVERLRADPNFGERTGRTAYLEAMAQRDAAWRAGADESPDKLEELKRRYLK
jgi:hypothetical protein